MKTLIFSSLFTITSTLRITTEEFEHHILIMAQKNEFQGWMGLDKNAVGNMKWQSFEPKQWEETDVEIKVTHCGFVNLIILYESHILIPI